MILPSLECIFGLILYSRGYKAATTINDSFFSLIWLIVDRNIYLNTMSYKDDQYMMKYSALSELSGNGMKESIKWYLSKGQK